MDHEGRKLHDARSLHGWLRVSERFAQWVGRRIREYGFEEGTDFFRSVGKTRGRARKDYLLTRDMAKELAMIERTPVGREARRYFIRMEQAAVEMADTLTAQGTPEAVPQDFFDARAEFAAFAASVEARMAALEARGPGHARALAQLTPARDERTTLQMPRRWPV